MKIKEGGEWDVRPIAVGEVLRRCTGKCLCSVTKIKASQFFILNSMEWHVLVDQRRLCTGFALALRIAEAMIDMHNAFNSVSRQLVLDECREHFPELLPWVSWCYSQHPLLWHTFGVLHFSIKMIPLATAIRLSVA